MTNLEKLLQKHVKAYPKAELTDVFKLLYQNEFGCGHLVENQDDCIEKVFAEYEEISPNKKLPLLEAIGNGYMRLNLARAKAEGYPPELIGKIFFQSAKRQGGNLTSFYEKINFLKNLNLFPADEINLTFLKWKEAQMPPFRHSKAYKEQYAPAYRIVEDWYKHYFPLMKCLFNLLEEKPVTVAIDGRCSSGKTTLANFLSAVFDGSVIHMDDFFLPMELRTKKRLLERGGNVHYERFKSQVAVHLKSGLPFHFHVFDCSVLDYLGEKTIQPTPLTIVEGSYSLHPYFGDIYDVKVFLTIPKSVQKRRIIRRNGDHVYPIFKAKWIPLEEAYFKAFKIKKNCHFIIKSL